MRTLYTHQQDVPLVNNGPRNSFLPIPGTLRKMRLKINLFTLLFTFIFCTSLYKLILRQDVSEDSPVGSKQSTEENALIEALENPGGNGSVVTEKRFTQWKALNEPPLINPVQLCQSSSAHKLKILFLVPSLQLHHQRRDIIRKTWATITQNNTSPWFRYAFLFGSRGLYADVLLQEESKRHNDIIAYSFIDSYKNLTLKSLTNLKWATKYCSNAEYVMKIDDDVYLNVTNLLKVLSRHKSSDKFMLGKVHGDGKVTRHVASKWYVTFEDYPYDKFPPYCDGSAYVMPLHVGADVLEVADDVRSIFLEDVYMGMCMKELSYKPRNERSIHYPRTLAIAEHRHCSKEVTTVHNVPISQIKGLWKKCNDIIQ